MVASTHADSVVLDNHVESASHEAIGQVIDGFLEGANGAFAIRELDMDGHFGDDISYKDPTNPVQYRDIGAAPGTALADNPVEEINERSVKVNRTYGPFSWTVDQFKKHYNRRFANDPVAFSRFYGTQLAAHKFRDMLNTSVLSARTAIGSVAANTVTAAAGLTSADLLSGMQLLEDRGFDVRLWVMHPSAFWPLMQEQVGAKLFEVTSHVMFEGTPATYGIPILMSKIPGLDDGGGNFFTLGLTEAACGVVMSEPETLRLTAVDGEVQMRNRLQGEFAYNLSLKGFGYAAAGPLNPNDAALATAANWDKVFSYDNTLAGLRIQHT